MNSDLELAHILLDRHCIDANTPTNGTADMPVLAALRKGHPDMAWLLLANSADPNAMSDSGASLLLQVCISRADLEGIELLLMASAKCECAAAHWHICRLLAFETHTRPEMRSNRANCCCAWPQPTQQQRHVGHWVRSDN